MRDEQLIDPSLLEGLTEEQRQEALAAAAVARRAEERAEQRELERALKRKEEERLRMRAQEEAHQQKISSNAISSSSSERLVFVPKKKRANDSVVHIGKTSEMTNGMVKSGGTERQQLVHVQTKHAENAAKITNLSESEILRIKQAYLGKTALGEIEEAASKKKRQRTHKKVTFKFRWDDTDDTLKDDDPLYSSMLPATLQKHAVQPKKRRGGREFADVATMDTVHGKPVDRMTARDWRIFRENYEIVVKGGKSPPPMRYFRESPSPEIPSLHPTLIDAIENVFRFKEPSPIQRQAIPIGLQRRDLIGIAETGSGKTVAFGVPLCHYLLNLPKDALERVAAEGPLALVMAPTRELALQIDGELGKLLSRQHQVSTCAVVGGQSIQQQAQRIRGGVHIIVGTPGRINDCIDMAYLVLNQCSYIILDEADRMIDMGFAPQIETILDAMGGKLKSENETEAYEQEVEDLQHGGVARHRVTAMFSATMPMEVERLAKQYLRHPAIISIGDQDSRKNARIVQKLVWLSSPSQKENALRDQLTNPRFLNEKVIVFVNEKKHADAVGRMIERAGRRCVVLHGGKSQEQREESLEAFRRGGVVMCATDVMGRGVDVPNVELVINFDLPTRSIENYTHRIGRTGRAGKEGVAVSFITDEDEGIMAALKDYLESTGNTVPERLARHPAANEAAPNALII